MGRSTPVCQLKCSRCQNRDASKVMLGVLKWRTWNNVTAVKRVGNKILCRCGDCEYEYLSESAAAKASMRMRDKTTWSSQ